MNVLLTGPPGVGKTTILDAIKERLIVKGYSVGGIYCPEIKEKGRRTGFKIIDIASGKQGVLASSTVQDSTRGPKVGRYTINLDDIDKIGVFAIKNALKADDYIFIDEIAPMELKSKEFPRTVWDALESQKPVIAVIHQRSQHPFILKVKKREDVMVFNITIQNRNSIMEEILKIL
jgi:nucleoside-triphosphatase